MAIPEALARQGNMADHPFRPILAKYTDEEIARACYRQLWQCFDASGHSMGRSMESAWLEVANQLIGDVPGELSKLSDDQPREFYLACEEHKHARWREEAAKRDAEFFAEVNGAKKE